MTVAWQHMMARQMVFGEINAPLEDIGIHGAGMAFKLAGNYPCPVSPTESVVETHALGGIGLAVLAQEMPVSLSPTASPKFRATALDQKNVPGKSGRIC